MMRGLMDGLRDHIHIEEVFNLEMNLFGWLYGGKLLMIRLQEFQQTFDGYLFKEAIDLIFANLYSFHFGAPLIAGWILWETTGDRKMYYRFVYTLTVLNIMALATFYIYPAAPPWYVSQYGFVQPSGGLYGTAGSLVNIDRMFEMNFFTTIWDNMNPNHFAAIPSLHGAYPILVSYFLFIKLRRYHKLFLFYPIGTWFAAMYLNHHYLIDLVIGGIYLVIAYFINEKILIPFVFNKTVFKNYKPDTKKDDGYYSIRD